MEKLAFNNFLFFCCSSSLSETYFSEHELFSVGGTTVTGEHVKLWHHKCEKWTDKDSQIYSFKSSDNQASKIKMPLLKIQ